MTCYCELDETTQELIHRELIKIGYEINDNDQPFYTYNEWCEYIMDNFIANSLDNQSETERYFPTKMQMRSSPYEAQKVDTEEYINGKTIKSTIYINWELLFNDRIQDQSLNSIIIEGTEYYYYD